MGIGEFPQRCSTRVALIALGALALGLLPAPAARAQATPAPTPTPSWVADLEQPAPLPPWLKDVSPSIPTVATRETAFEVTRPDGVPQGDLLLTVYFDEREGGFLRVYRKDGDQAQTLSDNLYEGSPGLGLRNQRTLWIPAVGAAPTTLVFQGAAGPLPVRRLVWEWPQVIPLAVVHALPAPPLVLRQDAALAADDLSGQPPAAPPQAIDIGYTATPLLDQPARIDGAALFTVALDRLPSQARLAGKVAGLAPGQELECWLNGRRAGVVALPVPPLRDPAWFRDGGSPVLAGWRAGSLALPAAWTGGENQIELRPAGSDPAAYAVKDLVLELVYDADPAKNPLPSIPATAPSTPTPP